MDQDLEEEETCPQVGVAVIKLDSSDRRGITRILSPTAEEVIPSMVSSSSSQGSRLNNTPTKGTVSSKEAGASMVSEMNDKIRDKIPDQNDINKWTDPSGIYVVAIAVSASLAGHQQGTAT